MITIRVVQMATFQPDHICGVNKQVVRLVIDGVTDVPLTIESNSALAQVQPDEQRRRVLEDAFRECAKVLLMGWSRGGE